MLLKKPVKGVLLVFLANVFIVLQVFSQTTSLSFTSIPIANADINAPGRGVEQWHDQNLVNVPVEGTNTQRLDVYYRFVWTQIEGPTLGSYNWSYFDGLVNAAITKKQKFSFGIMPLYPGGTTSSGLVSFDGGLASYPLYLHTLMQAETVKDWRTGTVWTPNYNSTNYQNRLLALHQAIDAHIKSTSFNGVPYRNVISCIDIRGYGAWGEWHSGYTPNNVISDYPAGTFPTVASLKKIVDAHTQGFPDFPLVAMIAGYDANWLQNTMNPPEIAYYLLTQRNNWGLIGWRRDQWGATDSYVSSYLENNTRSFNGLVFRDSIMVRWKSAPITGEPPGWVPSNYSDLERQIRLYHATSFGNGNYGGTLTTTIKNIIRASSKACGYRLIIEGGSMTTACRDISLTLNWKNTGQAPIYENWDVMFELKNGSNVVVWSGTSQFKPKMFLPAATSAPATDNFNLPANLAAGTYNLNVIVKDPNGYRDPLPLAINGKNADGSYPVSQITIPSGPAVSVVNNCTNSVLTATGFTGTLLWNTGATTASITVNTPGTYSVTETVNGCTSAPTSATAAPLNSTLVAPTVNVTNNCGSSLLTASGFIGALLWSTGATTNSITVTTPGTYTVTQTVSGCTSPPGSGIAAPATAPVLSSNLSGNATSGTIFTYTPTSSTSGTTFTWSRAAVAGISNAAATGSRNISETLVNTTASPVIVTYVYTLTSNGCSNTQNVLVTVGIDGSIGAPAITTQPTSQTKCDGIEASFSSAASGSPAPTVQWQETTNGNSWHNISGATAGTLSITASAANSNNQYRAVWTNVAGSVTSSTATLTVNPNPSAPSVSVVDDCGTSVLTATGSPTASFSWSTGATTSSITLTTPGSYTVSQTVNGCTSPTASGTAAPKSIPAAPLVSVINNCGSSVVTANGAPTATFMWSTGATTASITVTTSATFTVTQTVNGCTSAAGSGTSNYRPIPELSSNLTATATSGTAFTYTPTSSTSGTTFAWSRAAVAGISNVAANGTGSITETLTNTTASPVTVTYVYTSTANGCTNTQNVLVAVGVDGSMVSPSVTTQPASQTKCAGENVIFSSNAGGSPAPTVQWQESTNGTTWNNISGATSGTLSFTTTTAENNRQYRAVWTNIAGTVNSTAAVLTVNSMPSAPSVSVTNNCGSSVLTASGAPTATFLWNTGATTASITVTTSAIFTVTQMANGCTSAAGSGTSNYRPIPELSSNLTATATSGTAFTYTPTSSTSGTTFAWVRAAVAGISNVAANGTGSITETLTNTTASPVTVTYVYTLTANGCTNTQNVLVTVGVDGSIVSPSVTTQPASQTKCAGENVIFNSAASGSPAPTVQWQESTNGTNWNNISGATSGTLSFATSTTDNNKQYRAVWTNIAGTVNSSAAVLTVNPVPSAPSVSVADNCGSSVLTVNGAPTATFLWNTGATTASITVTTSATFTVTQTVNGCTSTAGSGTSSYRPVPGLSSSMTATATSGTAFNYTPTSSTSGTTFAWSRAAVAGISNAPANGSGSISETLINTTASPVTVAYVYTLTANACTNTQNVVVTVNANSVSPAVTTQPASQTRCSGLTASFSSSASGSPAPTVQWQESTNGTSWNNISGATSGTLSFTTTTADNSKQYRAVWTNIAGTVNSTAAVLTVNVTPAAPSVSVVDNCGSSVLTAAGAPGATFSWNTGATTSAITVATAGTYAATQTLSGCPSPAGSGVAAPKLIPVLSSNLSATATSGTAFLYSPTSTTTGTTFTWSRAAVTGISNAAANGTGSINETLVNTTASPISVTYVYTLTANGCINTQNLVVTVNPPSIVNCVINGSIASSFNSTSIPAGRFIWFSSAMDRGNLNGITGTVTFNITNSRITFTANSQVVTLNVPNSRIRFDAAITSATTQFINNVWETMIPRSYSGYVFMGGLNYQVPANLPGNISNVTWTATISIDKAGVRPTWKWAAAVYTSLAAHSGLNIKPKNGSTQNPYPNNDEAGTPENYKTFLVAGAKGNGGTNYTGNYSNTSSATCSTGVGQRSAEPVVPTEQLIVKEISELPNTTPEEAKLRATAVPNPSASSFNLMVKGSKKSLVSIKVIDISGRVVERHEKVPPGSFFMLGKRLAAGSYFIEVTQDNKKEIIRVIKVN